MKIKLSKIILTLSEALDLVSPAVVRHHQRVGYLAFSLAEECGLGEKEKRDLLLAGVLHDIGALSLEERISTLKFELDNPGTHAKLGAALLKNFAPLASLTPLLLYHHEHWENGHDLPLTAHILHLADRIDVLIKQEENILGQVDKIKERIAEKAGTLFSPDLITIFFSLAEKEYIWLDLVSSNLEQILEEKLGNESIKLSLEEMLDFAKMFSHIIDFRSHFTATHSSGVAASAEKLAQIVGFSQEECLWMRVAGYLHDLGKLAVAKEILEKTDGLTVNEFNIIKEHTYHTYHVLKKIPQLDLINTWAAYHHERLDGKGYPFHHNELSLGSRIMAVADVFTALTEDRPYRKGMGKKDVLNILQNMVNSGGLDGKILDILEKNYHSIEQERIEAQKRAEEEYKHFMQS